MSSSVLFERTLAIRQGIHSLADLRTGRWLADVDTPWALPCSDFG
ncbi:hypothetical protein [Microcoleus vaginatus]